VLLLVTTMLVTPLLMVFSAVLLGLHSYLKWRGITTYQLIIEREKAKLKRNVKPEPKQEIELPDISIQGHLNNTHTTEHN
jgi:hypothetical protein